MPAGDANVQVQALRGWIDDYDNGVVLPAFAAAAQAPQLTVDVDERVEQFLAQTAAELEAAGVPTLAWLGEHLIKSVSGQLTTAASSPALADALVARNWLATALMGAYKASGDIQPLQQERVTAMKQARTAWVQQHGVAAQIRLVNELFQKISDDADVYQAALAAEFAGQQLTIPALSALEIQRFL